MKKNILWNLFLLVVLFLVTFGKDRTRAEEPKAKRFAVTLYTDGITNLRYATMLRDSYLKVVKIVSPDRKWTAAVIPEGEL